MIELIYMAVKALKDLKITDEVTIIQEERSKHFHVWIFPNHQWMNEKFGKGITYLREISSYVQKNIKQEEVEKILKTVERLKKYFKNLELGE